jgi:zinc-binding alcohol dehydrogenase family protein
MKAVGYRKPLPIREPDSLLNVELPNPPTPSGRDLLVQVKAISVNPVDAKMRIRRTPKDGGIDVLGWDASGVVLAVGDEVQLFEAGDEVYYAGSIDRPGSYAERQLVDEHIVGRKPSTLGFAEAAALPLTAITAWELLFDRLGVERSDQPSGETLLIVGAAGGVGSILTQLARRLTGLTVIGTASRQVTQEWVRSLGAHHVIDHSQPLTGELRRIGVPQVSYVAGLTHTPEHFAEIAEALAPQGRFALIDDLGQRHRPAAAQEYLAALGVHVHPPGLRHARYGRPARTAR